jgi:Skp family chaperone for outer membrane proteins
MKTSVSTLAVVATALMVWMATTAMNQATAQNQPAGGMQPVTRLAVVDIVRVFDTFEQTVVLNKKLDAHTRVLSEEAEKRARQAQSEQDALQAFAPDSADWFKQNEKVKRMVFENEVWRQLERESIGESHKRWVLRTYQMMISEIEKAARARSVDVVLTREQLKADLGDSKALLAQILSIKVVYADSNPNIDLTEEVLANLNAEFQKRGGAAAIEFSR